MVMGKAKKSKDWDWAIEQFIILLYEDGKRKDGAPHYSKKMGLLKKVTKTHHVFQESGKRGLTGINSPKITRFRLYQDENEAKRENYSF